MAQRAAHEEKVMEESLYDAYEAIGRAITATGHARFMIEALIVKAPENEVLKTMYVKLGGAKATLQQVENDFEDPGIEALK